MSSKKKDDSSDSGSGSDDSDNETSNDSSGSESESESESEKEVKKKAKKKVVEKRKAPQRGKKRKAPAKKKDPKAPKKPLSAYMIFTQDKRAEIQKENPEKKFGELSKLMGALWKKMGETEKKFYNDKAEAEKKRYKKEMEGYTPPEDSDSDSDSDDGKKKRKAKRPKKDPNAPKKPSNAYMFFQKAIREELKKENPDLKVTELAKKMGAKWKKLSDSEKKPYVEQANDDKERYKKDMEKYTK